MHTVGSTPVRFASWLPDVAGALAIAVMAAVLGRMVMDPVARLFDNPSHGRMLGRFAAVLVWGAGAAAALSRVGVPASITLPILVTVVLIVGGVLVVLVGPDLLGFTRRRRQGGLRLVEGHDTVVDRQFEAYRRDHGDAAGSRRLPYGSRQG